MTIILLFVALTLLIIHFKSKSSCSKRRPLVSGTYDDDCNSANNKTPIKVFIIKSNEAVQTNFENLRPSERNLLNEAIRISEGLQIDLTRSKQKNDESILFSGNFDDVPSLSANEKNFVADNLVTNETSNEEMEFSTHWDVKQEAKKLKSIMDFSKKIKSPSISIKYLIDSSKSCHEKKKDQSDINEPNRFQDLKKIKDQKFKILRLIKSTIRGASATEIELIKNENDTFLVSDNALDTDEGTFSSSNEDSLRDECSLEIVSSTENSYRFSPNSIGLDKSSDSEPAEFERPCIKFRSLQFNRTIQSPLDASIKHFVRHSSLKSCRYISSSQSRDLKLKLSSTAILYDSRENLNIFTSQNLTNTEKIKSNLLSEERLDSYEEIKQIEEILNGDDKFMQISSLSSSENDSIEKYANQKFTLLNGKESKEAKSSNENENPIFYCNFKNKEGLLTSKSSILCASNLDPHLTRSRMERFTIKINGLFCILPNESWNKIEFEMNDKVNFEELNNDFVEISLRIKDRLSKALLYLNSNTNKSIDLDSKDENFGHVSNSNNIQCDKSSYLSAQVPFDNRNAIFLMKRNLHETCTKKLTNLFI